ncbi:hypothetical protein AB6A40_009096 [Gnathostoma spinigerum]|uniref:Uncharacterized protein n=1 Tax=Gnathostoma spinigerum TaxID=75299 RepID=A0ABD6F055_9BILA
MHELGIPWTGAIVTAGLALRLLTSPTQIMAERLFAKRLHASNFFRYEILKRIGAEHRLDIVPSSDKTKFVLSSDDKSLLSESERMVSDYTLRYLKQNGLQASRIQNLKMCTIPVWIFSSFAIRNIITSEFHPCLPGILWFNNLLLPDEYFVLPIAVGVFGFFNLWSQRRIYPVNMDTFRTRCYDFLLVFFTLFAVRIMMDMPSCIPLYWLTVSATGMVQNHLLRHPTVKKFFGIQKLPTDSVTPFRDLFFMRRSKFT